MRWDANLCGCILPARATQSHSLCCGTMAVSCLADAFCLLRCRSAFHSRSRAITSFHLFHSSHNNLLEKQPHTRTQDSSTVLLCPLRSLHFLLPSMHPAYHPSNRRVTPCPPNFGGSSTPTYHAHQQPLCAPLQHLGEARPRSISDRGPPASRAWNSIEPCEIHSVSGRPSRTNSQDGSPIASDALCRCPDSSPRGTDSDNSCNITQSQKLRKNSREQQRRIELTDRVSAAAM